MPPDDPEDSKPREYTPEEQAARKERLESIKNELNSLYQRSMFEYTLETGDIVLSRFFDANPELFARTYVTDLPYRKFVAKWRHQYNFLLEPVTRRQLQRMVKITAQYRRFPEDLQQGLSLALHTKLLRVRDFGERIAFARQALAEGWSPDDLDDHIPFDPELGKIRRRFHRLAIRLRRLELRLAARNETSEEREARLDGSWDRIHSVVAQQGYARVMARYTEWKAEHQG
jgi:hypothetical protein